MSLAQIIEGWKNNLLPAEQEKELIQQVSDSRMLVCNECEHISTKHKSVRPDVHCVNCGCTLAAKTKCLSCSCPINKWSAVLTKEQEDEIMKDGK